MGAHMMLGTAIQNLESGDANVGKEDMGHTKPHRMITPTNRVEIMSGLIIPECQNVPVKNHHIVLPTTTDRMKHSTMTSNAPGQNTNLVSW
jgi:hypothetical protein